MILYFLKLGHIIFDVLFYFFSVSSEKSLGFRLYWHFLMFSSFKYALDYNPTE